MNKKHGKYHQIITSISKIVDKNLNKGYSYEEYLNKIKILEYNINEIFYSNCFLCNNKFRFNIK